MDDFFGSPMSKMALVASDTVFLPTCCSYHHQPFLTSCSEDKSSPCLFQQLQY